MHIKIWICQQPMILFPLIINVLIATSDLVKLFSGVGITSFNFSICYTKWQFTKFCWHPGCRSTFFMSYWDWRAVLMSYYGFLIFFIWPGQKNPCRNLHVCQNAFHKTLKLKVYWFSIYLKYGCREMIWPSIQESLQISKYFWLIFTLR